MNDREFHEYTYILHKPLKHGEKLEEWLDRWYVERPVDSAGTPIRLGDFVRYGDDEIHEIYGMMHHYCGWSLIDEDEEFTDAPEAFEICERDSIELLRHELCVLHGCYAADLVSRCRECDVTKWLERAEKLFKEE